MSTWNGPKTSKVCFFFIETIYGDCVLALNRVSSYTQPKRNTIWFVKGVWSKIRTHFVLPWSPQGWNLWNQETIVASWGLRGDMSNSNRNPYNEEVAKFRGRTLSYLHETFLVSRLQVAHAKTISSSSRLFPLHSTLQKTQNKCVNLYRKGSTHQ